MSEADETARLLRAWQQEGDRAALEELLERNLEFVHALVRKRLGPALRAKLESVDLVQAVALDVLQYGPRFVVDDQGQLRGLLARMVENNIRDRDRWMRAERRSPEREHDGISVDLTHRGTSPSMQVDRKMKQELVRLAVELLDESDREVVFLHHVEERPIEEVADRLGLQRNTARMRYQRALPRLALKVQALLRGELDVDAQDPTD